MNQAPLAEPSIAPVADIPMLRVGLVIYGEVGTIFGRAIVRAGVASVTAFDVKIADTAWSAAACGRAAFADADEGNRRNLVDCIERAHGRR